MQKTNTLLKFRRYVREHTILSVAFAACGITMLTMTIATSGAIEAWLVRPNMRTIEKTVQSRPMTLRERAMRRRLKRMVVRSTVVSQYVETRTDGPDGAIVHLSSSSASSVGTPLLEITVVKIDDASSSMSSLHAAARDASSASSVSNVVSTSSSNISSARSVASPTDDFPAPGNAVLPVSRVPNWGAMTTPAEWNRTYAQMTDDDFVAIPSYDLSKLTIPTDELAQTRNDPATIKILTAKLFYSTRFFGAYDIDADEFTGDHPGVDLKLPQGTPIGAVAGGRVRTVTRDESTLGLHVIIEHRMADGSAFYSIYGHLGSASVSVGDDVSAGKTIGTVGLSGNVAGAHLHLQIDRGEPDETNHAFYRASGIPARAEADRHVINPITFIRAY